MKQVNEMNDDLAMNVIESFEAEVRVEPDVSYVYFLRNADGVASRSARAIGPSLVLNNSLKKSTLRTLE